MVEDSAAKQVRLLSVNGICACVNRLKTVPGNALTGPTMSGTYGRCRWQMQYTGDI